MNFSPRQRQIVSATAGLLGRAVPEVSAANRAALALAFAEHVRQLIQEARNGQEIRVGSVGDRSVGGDRVRDHRHSAAQPLIHVVVGMLPEWVRLDMWHSLNTRYGSIPLDDSQWATYDGTNDVPYAPV